MDFFGDLVPNASEVVSPPNDGANTEGLAAGADAKPEPVKCPEWVAPVQAKIAEWFKSGYKKHVNRGADPSDQQVVDHINDLLKTNGALISGGFLLEAIGSFGPVTPFFKSKDIDMYVPSKNLSNFNKRMSKLFQATSFEQYNASSYCLSFLRKNGIRCVQTYKREAGDIVVGIITQGMDIMGVRLGKSPLNVVQNFDLTFCQIWYDGEMVYATHPQHIKDKKGFLQHDYIDSLISGNSFIKKRIQKYKIRGFQISVESMNNIPLEKFVCKPIQRDEEYYKKWVSRALFYTIMYNGIYKVNSGFVQYEGITSFYKVNIDSTRRTGPNRRHRRQLRDNIQPIEAMLPIEPTDGYDSDEFDITKPETYTPIINGGFVPADKIDEWDALDMENKFRKTIHAFLEIWYSLAPNINPLGVADIDILYCTFFEQTHFTPYYQALKEYTKREGMDAISLDDAEVFDLHTHSLDQAIGRASMEAHLRTLINQGDKNDLPCYADGCTWKLNLSEIRPIVSMEFYQEFTRPILPPPTPLLGEQVVAENPDPALVRRVDVNEILQNAPSDAGAWRNIYHHIMCPFCLGYITRDSGCTYVYHDNPDALPHRLMPFCKAQNLVSEVIDKYKLAAGNNSIETCAECGRPCSNHRHFDFNNPPGFVVQGANPDYARCPGGGRREGIARILAVKQTMIDNPGLELKELRRRAALAAEAAAQDGVMLAKADVILAKERFERKEANLNAALVAAVVAVPVAPPAPINPANAQEAADLQAALNAVDAFEAQQAAAAPPQLVIPPPNPAVVDNFVNNEPPGPAPVPENMNINNGNNMNININNGPDQAEINAANAAWLAANPEGGGHRIGKMTCPHGYGSYKSAIKSTRKRKNQSKRKTLKH